jgi:hypothetical protein
MKNIKITKRNFLKVAKNILELEHDPTRKEIFDRFNKMLDEMCEEDCFGTESQLDPRGDHRDFR